MPADAPSTSGQSQGKPRDEDIDVFGLTHPGAVRKENQDHFLIGSLSRRLTVDITSLPLDADTLVEPERLASIAMVADGVGSGAGEDASRHAVQAIAEYLARSTHVFYASEEAEPEAFAKLLSEAALEAHGALVGRAERDADRTRAATTLTLWLGLWPQAYLLQVGDSRCYLFRDGQLTQLSRDQTMAQELVDQGVVSRARISQSRLAHVLSSAIGGPQAAPVVTRVTRKWGTIVLLCSDGLTKHVSDEQIARRLASLTSAKQACEDLLQDALDGGGTDNITLVIGRTIEPDARTS
jgi:protein phosphatase